MSSEADKRVPRRDEEGEPGRTTFESHAELLTFARGYFAADFPNSERIGCPPDGTFGALVRRGERPDDRLHEHLFGCSECFNEFRQALETLRPAPPPAMSWRDKLAGLLRPVPVMAGVLALLLSAFAGIYLWRARRGNETPGVAGNQPPVAVAPAGEAPQPRPASTATPQPSPTPSPLKTTPRPASPQRAGAGGGGDLMALHTIRVDLEEYTALRGERMEKIITLPRARVRLDLRLPDNSPKGVYSLSVVDAYGKPLVKTRAHTASGKTLRAILELRGLAPQQYRLELMRGGEAPEYYPIVIGAGADTAPRSSEP